jgi:spore maturation protein CgeB
MGDGKKPSLGILYLGHDYGTSRHRADALRRLGHKVDVLDPWEFFPKGRISRKVIGKLVYEVGAVWLEPYVRHRLIQSLMDRHFDVILSDQCELMGRRTAAGLKKRAGCMITYAVDDPFGPRDRRRFSLYRKSLNHYDLAVVVRQPNVEEAYAQGATEVLRVLRTADEVAHRPLVLVPEEEKRWASAVAFIGTWMPERGPFLKRLIELGVPLTLYGDRWQKAGDWPAIKKAWRGPSLVGDSYVKAIQTAKVCLGLLSKGNRDLHTQRSAEIPCIGGILCAERTKEHVAMYREDKEAVLWSTPEECAEKCFALLADEPKRKAIAWAGRDRCHRSGYLNEPIMEKILNALRKRKMVPARYWSRSGSALISGAIL